MSTSSFRPELWEAQIEVGVEANLIFAQAGVIDRDYEGLIQNQGDTVIINELSDVTVQDYDDSAGFATIDELVTADQSLVINQSKGFNFKVKDIEKLQAAGELQTKASMRAAYNLAKTADNYVSSLYVDATPHATELGSTGTPKTISAASDAYEYLVDMGTVLSDTETPEEGRWVAVSPAFYGWLQKDDRFVASGALGADARLLNGQIGEAAGFAILKTTQCPIDGSGDTKIIAGHSMAWNYAEQINKVETFRDPSFFADRIRGLHLYGAKVTRPDHLAVLTVTL